MIFFNLNEEIFTSILTNNKNNDYFTEETETKRNDINNLSN